MDFLEILMDPMELNGDSMEFLDFLLGFFGDFNGDSMDLLWNSMDMSGDHIFLFIFNEILWNLTVILWNLMRFYVFSPRVFNAGLLLI